MSAPQIKITKLPPQRNSSHHHVGNPPKSFSNPWPSFNQNSPTEFLGSLLRRPAFKPVPSRDKLVTVQKPDWGADNHNNKKALKATWIGHATFLVETAKVGSADRGVRVLFDPVFAERTSPVSFAGPKRYTPTPCTLDELPDVDIVVISHDHYDHMDSDALLRLFNKGKDNIHFLVGLGNASRLRGFGIGEAAVTELDWWEGVRLDIGNVGSVTMTCTPSQHGSGRGLLDQKSTLWCSWVLRSQHDSKTLFFAGDTGYRYVPHGANESEMPCCPAFKEIGETYGPFDLSLLPIGLYSPRYMLSSLHCTPEDAVCLHRDLSSRKSVGMHFGTVRGGISQYYEDVTEPPRRFREACEREGMVWGEELCLVGVGETISV